MAHKLWHLIAAENFLKRKTASKENFKQAANIAMKDAKNYEYKDFKLKLAPNAIVETLKTVAGIV